MKAHFERIGRDVTIEKAHRSCLDKVRYDSRNQARDRSRHLRKKYPDSSPTRPYRCTICGGWHLASIRQGGGKPPGKTGARQATAQG